MLKLFFEAERDSFCRFTTENARSYEEAITRIKHHGHCMDVVLLDLGLPDAVGVDVVKGVVEACPVNLPVIVRTGRSSSEVEMAAKAAGADDFISKSADPRGLAMKIRWSVIDRRDQKARKEVELNSQEMREMIRRMTDSVSSAEEVSKSGPVPIIPPKEDKNG